MLEGNLTIYLNCREKYEDIHVDTGTHCSDLKKIQA